ncbi:MAG: YraN family protein [SAR324 cluster bacterium]|nr:YraN family protein [SAR324 cluster bacterium]
MIQRSLDLRNLGNTGEKTAAEYLISKGYRIRERNYRCRSGEIDIIAEFSEYIVFIEVKSRIIARNKISPLISVTKAKQNRIRKLGEIFLMHKKIKGQQPRFDVIGITFTTEDQFELEHIENAF